MERYKNLGGQSGVYAFEIGSDYIKVQFNDGATYLYNYSSAGSQNIQEMKRLANAGKGLNTFINKNVKKMYATRLN